MTSLKKVKTSNPIHNHPILCNPFLLASLIDIQKQYKRGVTEAKQLFRYLVYDGKKTFSVRKCKGTQDQKKISSPYTIRSHL